MLKYVYIAIILMYPATYSFGQTIIRPNVDYKTHDSISIMNIELNSKSTVISFVYQSDEKFVNGGWFNISPNIQLIETQENGERRRFKLIKAEGVKLAPEKTYSEYAGQIFSFRLTFPPIDYDISKVDIIECPDDSCFNFYGVSLINDNEEIENENSESFRVTYRYFTYWELNTKKWSEWIKDRNEFVFNINDNGDITHYMSSGDVVNYKALSPSEEGYTSDGKRYQMISVVMENGLEFDIQLFDDQRIGMKHIHEEIIVQFSNMQ